MSDSEDEFVLSEVIAEAQSFADEEITYDVSRMMWLIEALLIAAYDDPSEAILDPAMQLCDAIIARKQRLCQIHIRKAQVYFHQGSFILARQTLDIAEQFANGDALEREVNEFRQELHSKVTRDGKIAIFLIGGVISAGIFWWLSRNKRQREAEAAAAILTNETNDNIVIEREPRDDVVERNQDGL